MKLGYLILILFLPVISFSISEPDTLKNGNVVIPATVMIEVLKDLERGDQAKEQTNILQEKLEKEQAITIQKQSEINKKNEEISYLNGINIALEKQIELCNTSSSITQKGLEKEKNKAFFNGVVVGSSGTLGVLSILLILILL